LQALLVNDMVISGREMHATYESGRKGEVTTRSRANERRVVPRK
jgi:hypothetical protein